jgi:2-polyprenyl-3-methyl-5-hydroxy-6-metoxy-1,4-benzoquinol methylase
MIKKKRPVVNPKIKDQQKVIVEKLKKTEIRDKFLKLRRNYQVKFETFIKNRGYKEYNFAFRNLLDGMHLFEYIYKRFKTKREISILDEGAGFTRFLKEIKELFEKKGKTIETSAISLTPGIKKENTSHLNYLYKQKVQTFVPKKEYDVIISVFGGIHYNIKELDKNTVLKLAHSLSKNGVMFIGVNRINNYQVNLPDSILENIKVSLEKNGFSLKHKYNIENVSRKLPIHVFRIERK